MNGQVALLSRRGGDLVGRDRTGPAGRKGLAVYQASELIQLSQTHLGKASSAGGTDSRQHVDGMRLEGWYDITREDLTWPVMCLWLSFGPEIGGRSRSATAHSRTEPEANRGHRPSLLLNNTKLVRRSAGYPAPPGTRSVPRSPLLFPLLTSVRMLVGVGRLADRFGRGTTP